MSAPQTSGPGAGKGKPGTGAGDTAGRGLCSGDESCPKPWHFVHGVHTAGFRRAPATEGGA